MKLDEITTSGFLTDTECITSAIFTDISEISDSGFCRLIKAKRYGCWYILKCLKPEYQDSIFHKKLLNKEASIGLQLIHQNIVRFIGFEVVEHFGDCLIMEYIDGVTLKEFLEKNPSRQQLEKITKEILCAMDYFHSLQVVHKDLKPSNILITRNGNNCKIIDFGLSDTDNYNILKQPAGTKKYASPEQLNNNTNIDARADLYSFGLILGEMYEGKFAPIFNFVARKCLMQDPAQRFQSASEISNFLRKTKSLEKFVLRGALLLLAVSSAFVLALNKSAKEQSSTHDTVHVTTEVIKVQHDTINIVTPINKVHDTIFLPPKISAEREAVHKKIVDFIQTQLKPIKARMLNDKFIYDYTFRASLTNCYIYCQKTMRLKLAPYVTQTYTKARLFADIDSLTNTIIGNYRLEHEDELPSYEEEFKKIIAITNNDSLTAEERKRQYDEFSKKFDEDIILYNADAR